MSYRYKERWLAGYLARIFLHNPLTTVLGITLIALGIIALLLMPREEDPQISISGGVVIVGLQGATAEERWNALLFVTLERRIKEIKGVEHIYGIAIDNVGVVNAKYNYSGLMTSNLKLYDKVMQNIDQLPKGASIACTSF